jgi:hypothetical protein
MIRLIREHHQNASVDFEPVPPARDVACDATCVSQITGTTACAQPPTPITTASLRPTPVPTSRRTTLTATPSNSAPALDLAAILGGVGGGVALLVALIVLAAVWWRCRMRRQRQQQALSFERL